MRGGSTFVLRNIIFPDRGKNLDCCGVLDDLCAVGDIGGDAPRIAGASIVLSIFYFEQDMAFYEIARLLVGMAVVGQDVIFIEKKFGHQCSAAVTKSLLPDTLKGFFVTVFTVFANHLSLP